MTPQAVPAPDPAKAPMGEIGRLTGVFFEPTAAFADLAARPRWIVPTLLLLVLASVFIHLFTQRVGWDRFMRQMIEASPRVADLPAEQRERIIAQQARFAAPFAYAAVVVGTPVYMLISAAALLAAMNLLAAAQLTFKKMFAVVAYSTLPLAVSSILTIGILFLKDPEDFNLLNPTAFNVGAFLDPAGPRWLASLGASIDLFMIWTLLLIGIGAVQASGRIKLGKSLSVVFICWACWLVLKSGWTAITT